MKKLCWIKVLDYKNYHRILDYLTSNDIVFSVYIHYFYIKITVYE
jgi:hypothetical protein